MYQLLRGVKRAVRRKIRSQSARRAEANKPSYAKFWIGLSVASAILFTSFLFPIERLFTPISIPQVGEIADDDIEAPFDFPVYKSEAELEYEKLAVINALPAVLIYDQQIVDSMYRALERLFYVADSLKSRVRNTSRVAEKLRLFFPDFEHDALMALAGWSDLYSMKTILSTSLQERYIVGVSPTDSLVPAGFRNVSIRKEARDVTFASDQVLSSQSSRKKLLEDIQIHSGNLIDDAGDLFVIGNQFLQPNLSFSHSETEKRKEQALAVISREKLRIHSGQRLVGRNEQMTRAQVEWLTALAQHRSREGTNSGALQYLLPIFARVTFVTFIILSLLSALYYLRDDHEFRLSRILPLLIILVLTVLMAFLVTEEAHLSPHLVPFAAGVILAVILYDLQTAVLFTAAEALIFGVLYEFNFEISFLVTITGLVAAFSMREVKRRSDFYRCLLYLSLSQMATVYVLESLKLSDADMILRECTFGIAGAIGSTFIAMALLHLFESFFSFTTNVSLLELSDMNHPLLKRLAIEAPGTYHHSMVLGSLVEAAAKSVGANSLLARVGTYYHDIGKMEIPEYFIENQLGVKSKHEELTPSMSALVISSHIKRGRELAEENDLPDRIIKFIDEHHGTSLMSYFYNKAKEQSTNGEMSEAEFRYPGPKPQSKETAILMLADSIEAASRTLDDPKPARIRGLIKRLINERYQSGELSECDLTLADLQKIEDAIAASLMGQFHQRVDYPSRERESSK